MCVAGITMDGIGRATRLAFVIDVEENDSNLTAPIRGNAGTLRSMTGQAGQPK